jgi:hypothetical protein
MGLSSRRSCSYRTESGSGRSLFLGEPEEETVAGTIESRRAAW